jgi:hypothetical protein
MARRAWGTQVERALRAHLEAKLAAAGRAAEGAAPRADAAAATGAADEARCAANGADDGYKAAPEARARAATEVHSLNTLRSVQNQSWSRIPHAPRSPSHATPRFCTWARPCCQRQQLLKLTTAAAGLRVRRGAGQTACGAGQRAPGRLQPHQQARRVTGQPSSASVRGAPRLRKASPRAARVWLARAAETRGGPDAGHALLSALA